MNASGYYLAVLALCVGLVVKFPGMLRSWRDPLIRSVSLVIALGAAGFLFAAPPTITAVNETTGTANFSSALVYCIISAFSAACLLLIVHWRGGPPAYVRRVSRRWQAAYALVIVLLVILFVLGEAPAERHTDFDTYYATTPFIREMIVLYLLAHMTAALVTTILCWRWAAQVHGWLRAGLVILVLGWLLNLGFSSLKLAAVTARWAGQDWNTLSTTVAPFVSAIAAPCAVVGFLLPLVGPRLMSTWRAVADYRRLGPLWRAMNTAAPTSLTAPIPVFSSAGLRLTRREAGVREGLSQLRPYLDDRIRSRAQARAQEARLADAVVVGQAAMIMAAIRACRATALPVAAVPPADDDLPSSRDTLTAVSKALRALPPAAPTAEEGKDTVSSGAEDGAKSST
ncbi:MAB_1171c family putative transporter [Streptomyces sp. MMBL 11-3]|uniref:MAB_1171c family putative transporter n=1 Tax=Streptomyces sp. MMBL 11-3 TaxID=3382639 RepID=UPI0039B578A2